MLDLLRDMGQKLTPLAVVDILLCAFLIYELIVVVRGRRAAHILNGLWLLVVIYVVALWARLELLRSILAGAAPYAAFGLIVLFQSEIRRFLARLGRSPRLGLGGQLERREVTDEIVLAVQNMAQRKVGALIVIEREIGLRTFIESGVALDALISHDLLTSIFEPGNALHDGAALVQGDRVAAAGCFLPLTTNPALQNQLGTRHRAGIGVTEEADCIAVIVSEETGRVSVAAHGDIEFDISLKRLEEWLTRPDSIERTTKRDDSAAAEWKQVKQGGN
jgi:diadenylate cyclase